MGSTWYENGTGDQEPGTHPDPQLSPPSLADPLTKQSPGPSDLAPTKVASASHLLSPHTLACACQCPSFASSCLPYLKEQLLHQQPKHSFIRQAFLGSRTHTPFVLPVTLRGAHSNRIIRNFRKEKQHTVLWFGPGPPYTLVLSLPELILLICSLFISLFPKKMWVV